MFTSRVSMSSAWPSRMAFRFLVSRCSRITRFSPTHQSPKCACEKGSRLALAQKSHRHVPRDPVIRVSVTLSVDGQKATIVLHDARSSRWIEMTGWSETMAPMASNDRLFTVHDLAEYLGVPKATLYAWRYRGTGPRGFRVGRHVRYRWIDIQEWIERQLVELTP